MTKPHVIEVYLDGWKWESDCISLDAAKEIADDCHSYNGFCHRVVRESDGVELYRTNGPSEMENH